MGNGKHSTIETMRAKRLFTITEAAVYLGRTAWGVRHLIWEGTIPCVRVGKRVHVDVQDMDKLIERNKIQEDPLAA